MTIFKLVIAEKITFDRCANESNSALTRNLFYRHVYLDRDSSTKPDLS